MTSRQEAEESLSLLLGRASDAVRGRGFSSVISSRASSAAGTTLNSGEAEEPDDYNDSPLTYIKRDGD